MATINQDSINFTNVQPTNIFTAAGKYSISANDDGTGKFDTTLTGSEVTKSFNAIEIDWNNAAFKSAVDAITTVPDNGAIQSEIQNIKTTGELVKIIAKQQAQIDALIVMVKAFYQAVN